MNFNQALQALKEGKHITRYGWEQKNQLRIKDDGSILNYSLRIAPYLYDQTILTSEGWINIYDNDPKSLTWSEAIEALKMGANLKQEDWNDMYIWVDKASQSLVMSFYEVQPFMPTYICFVSNDWEIV